MQETRARRSRLDVTRNRSNSSPRRTRRSSPSGLRGSAGRLAASRRIRSRRVSPARIRSRRAKRLLSMPRQVFGTAGSCQVARGRSTSGHDPAPARTRSATRGRRVRNEHGRPGNAAPRVDGATPRSRHPWNDPDVRAAPTDRSRVGQDGRNEPPADPRSTQTTPITPTRNTRSTHPDEFSAPTRRFRRERSELETDRGFAVPPVGRAKRLVRGADEFPAPTGSPVARPARGCRARQRQDNSGGSQPESSHTMTAARAKPQFSVRTSFCQRHCGRARPLC
jgi:hypothetical protein